MLDEDGQVRRDGPDDGVGSELTLFFFLLATSLCVTETATDYERAATWPIFEGNKAAMGMKQQPTATRCQR